MASSSAFNDTKSLFENGGTPKKESAIASRAAAYEKATETKEYSKPSPKVDTNGNLTSGEDQKTPEDDVNEKNSPQGVIHKPIKHPWRAKEEKEVAKSHRRSLADIHTSTFSNISKQRKMQKEENAKPVSARKRKVQIIKCLVFSLLIAVFITLAAITIITGWGDGSTEMEFGRQGAVLGKLISVSQDGFVAVVGDDFGSNQAYRLDPNASPQWQPQGGQFRARGQVHLSGDGKKLAYMHHRSSRLQIMKYDDVAQNWVNTGEAPILGGDDVSIDDDFSTLCVGTYGFGTITQTNLKLGEGIITSYKSNGTDWLVHGEPLIKIFGLNFFSLSPDGQALVIVAESDGNTTLEGFKSDAQGNNTFEWLESERTIVIPTDEVNVAVSNAGYAVSSVTSAQAFTFSGRSMGQEILAGEDHNITSVSLSTDGHRMVIGSVSSGLDGVVDWYSYPKGVGSAGAWKNLGYPLRDASEYFGSAVHVNKDSTQLTVQDGSEGGENVHFYRVIYKAHRRVW